MTSLLLILLERAVKLDTTFATAWYLLAETYHSLQNVKMRNACIRKAMTFSEKSIEKERLYLEAGYASYIEKRPEKQIDVLKRLIQKYPQEKLVFYKLATAYVANHQNSDASSALERALKLDPFYGAAIHSLASVYAEEHKSNKALEYYTLYAAFNPGEAKPFDSMGDLYWKIGQFDEAMGQYQKVLDIKPGLFLAGAKVGYICAVSENYATALRYIDREITRSPLISQKSTLFFFKAFIEYWLGRTGQAFNDLARAKEIAKSCADAAASASADWLKALMYYDLGDISRGKNSFRVWRDYSKENDPANLAACEAENDFFLGLVHLRFDRIDSTKIVLTKIEKSMDEIPSERRNRCNYEFDLLRGETALAEDSPDKAISILKHNKQTIPNLEFPHIVFYNLPFLKDGLARAYLQSGKIDKAIDEYKRLIDIDIHRKLRYLIHPLYHYHLAILYEQKGARVKAAEQYQKFLFLWRDADGNRTEVTDARARLNALKNINR